MNDSKASNDRPVKKPYSKPVLQTYGDIRAMTRSLAGNGNDDGMSGAGMSKTS